MTSDLSALLAVSTMALATCGAHDEPHVAAVYFVADEHLRLFFFSDPQSQHSLDICTHARAAIAIYPPCSDWRDIHGLQMRGEVHPIKKNAGWIAAWRLYAAKFPFVNGLAAVVHRNTFYVFTPTWARLMDNRRGFGHKEEWHPS